MIHEKQIRVLYWGGKRKKKKTTQKNSMHPKFQLWPLSYRLMKSFLYLYRSANKMLLYLLFYSYFTFKLRCDMSWESSKCRNRTFIYLIKKKNLLSTSSYHIHGMKCLPYCSTHMFTIFCLFLLLLLSLRIQCSCIYVCECFFRK